MTDGACGVTLPWLFVYDLPPTYYWCLDVLGLRDADAFPRIVHNASSSLPQLRQTHGYALGSVFLARALSYTCRTLNARAANLFFVPALSETPSCARRCAEVNCSKDAIFHRLAPYLQAHGGEDHLLVSPRQGWREDLHPYYGVAFEDKRFGAATRFSAEEGAQYDWPVPATQALFRSMPQASYVHISASSGWEDSPWRSSHPRGILVGWASNLRHAYGAAFSSQLNAMRDALHRSCEGANDKQLCSHLPLSPTPTYKKLYDLKLVKQTSALYWNTTFCLQPIGDACTRKAIIDGLLLGCIPVLFHPCQHLQWPWHWGGWFRRASVSLEISLYSRARAATGADATNFSQKELPVDVVEELQRVPPSRIASMQRTIAEYAHCMHYTVPFTNATTSDVHDGTHRAARIRSRSSYYSHEGKLGDVPDAFEISLQGAWLLAQHSSSHVGANGLPLRPHQTNGGPSPDKSSSSSSIWNTLCRRVPVGRAWQAPICRVVGPRLCAAGHGDSKDDRGAAEE